MRGRRCRFWKYARVQRRSMGGSVIRFASLRQPRSRHLDHQRQMIVDNTSAAGADDCGRFAFLDNRRTIHVETGIKCVTIIDRGFLEAMLGKVSESFPL